MPARQPTELLESKGSYARHPERARQRALAPRGLEALPAVAPAHLSAPVADAYLALVAAAPEGVLARSDSTLTEIAAALLVEFRRGQQPAARTAILLRTLLEMGHSPVARSRLIVQPTRTRPADPDDDRPDPSTYFS